MDLFKPLEIDYDETYMPVVQMGSLRTICAIGACNNWPIHQMDVDVAYLNATLENLVYMQSYRDISKTEKEKFSCSRNVFMASSSRAESGICVY
jgi:hypothetical protein